MPFFVVMLGLFAPRLVLAMTYLLSATLRSGFSGILGPIVGFCFLPLTTLAYGLVMGSTGTISGLGFVLTGGAMLLDLGVVGGGVRSRTSLRNPLG